jgi:histone H3/H4
VSDDRDVDEIREDIEQNREDMGRTIAQIEERLSPDALQAQFTDIVRETTDRLLAEFESKTSELSARINEQVQSAVHGAATARTEQVFSEAEQFARKAGKTLWDRASANPTAMALAASAIGLLAVERSDMGPNANGNGGMIQQATSMMGDQVSGLKESISSLTNQAGEKATGMIGDRKEQVGQLAQQAPTSPTAFWESQPFTVGLLAAGLGFVAALSIPQSERERQVMAPVIEQAQERLDSMGVTDSTGQGEGGLIGQVKQTGAEIIGQAKSAATETLNQAGDMATSLGKTAVDSAQAAKSKPQRPTG